MANKLKKQSLFDKLKEEEEKLNNDFQEDSYEEDYLDVDKPLPNQNWVCMSFVSPEKVLKTKEDYYFYYYTLEQMNNYRDIVKSEIDKLMEKALSGSVDSSEIVDLRNELSKKFTEEQTFNDFKDKLDNFKYKNEQEIEKLYHEENNFHTTIRGIKIRGVFNDYETAKNRSKTLQKMDKNFNVFIGQVGYWLPWDPNPDNIEDQEYMNSKLNTIVKSYKENQEKKNAFFEEEIEKKKEDAIRKRREARKNKNKSENTEHNEEHNEEHQENPLEDVMEKMNSEPNFTSQDQKLAEERAKIENIDPWMQRKIMEQSKNMNDDSDM